MKESSRNLSLVYGFVGAGVFWALAHSGPVFAQVGSLPAYLRLQNTTPGTQQSGHANVSGTVVAGQFVGGGAGLTSVNAALLNGLSSAAFLQSVPNPLTLTGSQSGSHIVKGINSSTTADSSGVFGQSTASSGATSGVIGFNSSTTGLGLYGRAFSGSGANFGVWGQSASASGTGVHGVVTASAGTNYGLSGRTQSPAGYGVYGFNASSLSIPKPVGIFGEVSSDEGTGLKGKGGAVGVSGEGLETGVEGSTTTVGSVGVFGYYNLSGFGMGVAGFSSTSAGLGLNSYGDATIIGDLTVQGTKVGYVSDIILNVGSEPLEGGDVVEICGSDVAIQGEIPVITVRKSTSAASKAVLGPVDCALQLLAMQDTKVTAKLPRRLQFQTPQYRAYRVDGSIRPGGYGRAVTLGSFKAIKVDATFGAIRPGDLLVSSPNPGFAMAIDDPRAGTVIGKALGKLDSGQGTIPILVQSR